MVPPRLRPPTILFCDVKAPSPQARLLTLERFTLQDGKPQPGDTLVVPEDAEAIISKSKTDRFFVDLQGSPGYLLKNRALASASKEWGRIDGFLEKSPLVDLRRLLKMLFPTLIATTLPELRRAFGISTEIPPIQAVAELTGAAERKGASMPGSVTRILKQVFRLMPPAYGEWLAQLPKPMPEVGFDFDRDFFIDLDRFENLTSGCELTSADVRAIFAGDSPLVSLIDGYEPRRGQAKYAEAVSKAMERGEIALLEAATGTGKSIGYLLPAIARCREEESRVVIVTRTKSLQEQLFRSDLKKIKGLIPPGLKIALLKGLANYLCLLKYKIFLSSLAEASAKLSPEHLATLVIWAHETRSGDLTESEVFDQPDSETLLERITLDETTCLGKDCSFYADCHAFRARKNAARSRIVITNYALLFSDLLADGAILGRFAHAVLDEAHRLEAEAANAFTESLPLLSFGRALERVSGNRFLDIVAVLIGDSGETSDVANILQERGSHLSERVREVCRHLHEELATSGKGFGERVRFKPGERLHSLLCEWWKDQESILLELKDSLASLQQEFSPGQAEEPEWEMIADVKRHTASVVQHIDVLKAISQMSDQDVVMWGQYHESGEVVITMAPMNVGVLLQERLYSRFRSVILTSATLDSEDGFQWIISRLGLAGDEGIVPSKLKIHSPFPLSQQLLIALARYLPPPTAEQYALKAGQLLVKLRSSVRLPTLVLCTSYRMIESLAKPLASQRDRSGELLIQTPDSVPQTLLNRFRQLPCPILIGTESFWEGVDLPGALLRLLIMTRLPFPVPDDPLELAKQEAAEKRGESPFMTVSLPAAILKFRQGIGRMIRSSSDWGAVIITDSRMGHKNYGRILFDAAPSPVQTFDYESLLVKETSRWLYEMQGKS